MKLAYCHSCNKEIETQLNGEEKDNQSTYITIQQSRRFSQSNENDLDKSTINNSEIVTQSVDLKDRGSLKKDTESRGSHLVSQECGSDVPYKFEKTHSFMFNTQNRENRSIFDHTAVSNRL